MTARIALVTGAANGLGRAIATNLAKQQHQVVVADVNAAAGQALAHELGSHFINADLSRRADCQRLIAETLAHFGGLDILINNAGFQHLDPIEAFPEDTWDAMLAVMLTAPFLLTKYAWPTLKARGWGRIVNIASIHALVASPYKSAYVAAKHGLLGLTRTAALEGGAHGITVNAICPAYARTALVEKQIVDQARTRGISQEEVTEQVMLGPAAIKRLIEPDEVAATVAFLCSDSAAAVTGAAWTIDLGWTAR